MIRHLAPPPSQQTSIFSLATVAEPILPGVLTWESDDDDILDFILDWQNADRFACDIETYSDSDPEFALDPFLGNIRCIQIGLDPESKRPRISEYDVLIVDLGGYDDDREAHSERYRELGFFQALKKTLEDPQVWSIGQNLGFDLQWLYHWYGIRAQHCADTFLLSQVYWAGVSWMKHSLGAIVARALGIHIDKSEQRSNFGFELTNSQINYAANDVRILFPLWKRLTQMCADAGLTQTVNCEFGALPAFAEMNIDGFPVDYDELLRIRSEYESAKDQILKPFNEAFPGLGISNSKELPIALQKLGIFVASTGKDVLSQYRDQHPEIESLLSGRSVQASINYLDGMIEAYHDGSVRGGFKQFAREGRGRSTSGDGKNNDSGDSVAKTGEQHKRAVNLQNPPNPSKYPTTVQALNLTPVRAAFRAPEGYCLFAVDLDGAHARAAAQGTQDQLLVGSFSSGLEIHSIVSSLLAPLVGKGWSEDDISRIRKEKTEDGTLATSLRNCAKNVFYAWLNGAAAKKIASVCSTASYECSVEYAQSIIDKLNLRFPGIAAYHKKLKQHLATELCTFPGSSTVYSWWSGPGDRRVFLPLFENKGISKKTGKPYSFISANFNDALMVGWMGTEGSTIKMAMNVFRLETLLHPEWDARLVCNCHDELIAVGKEEYKEAIAHCLWISVQGCFRFFLEDLPATDKPFSVENVCISDWSVKG